MIRVVCNASPIIALAKLGSLNVLYELFDVYISREVYNEVVFGNKGEAAGKEELIKAVQDGNIKIYEVKDKELVNKLIDLHRGEIGSIIAAKEMDVSYVIIDEISQKFFQGIFIKPIGTLGSLQMAKKSNKIEH